MHLVETRLKCWVEIAVKQIRFVMNVRLSQIGADGAGDSNDCGACRRDITP